MENNWNKWKKHLLLAREALKMGLYRAALRDKKEREYPLGVLFRRYLQQLAPFKKNIIFIALFIMVQAVSDLLAPLFVRFASDEFLAKNPRFSLIIFAASVYLALYVINWIAFSAQRTQLGKYIPFFLEKLRFQVFQEIQKQDMSFFDKRNTGKLNSIVVNDTLDFTSTAVLITDALGNIFISVLTFIILLSFNITLALITMASAPILFILMYILRHLSKRVSMRYRKAIAAIQSSMVESIEGIQTSKSFGQELAISQQFEDINKEYLKSWMQLTAVTHFWRPLLNTLSAIVICLVLYFGSLDILTGGISPGTMVMFLLYLQTFFRPILTLARFFPELQAGMASYERILGILDTKPKVVQNPNPRPMKVGGDIEFKEVHFEYDENNAVFDKLSLKISKGEKLAIVGHTGAGKTSLTALLGRYYEFQEGSILVDGKDIRDIQLESYRKYLGKVEQDVFLFPGTILENITYGRQEASEGEVIATLRAVQALEFIESLPNGIHTRIGERGKELSAGQRQLISFARAILLNPSILILDEATSSVDAYTEAMIQEALDEILKNRTAIIIAHRLSTIVDADRIIIMDHGQIVEEGTHEELLANEGKYADLYNQYFVHQSWEWQLKQARD